MKKLILLVCTILISTLGYSQGIGHYVDSVTVKRGDTLDVAYWYMPDTTKDIRSFQIDFQFKRQLFTHLSTYVDAADTTMSPSLSYNEYPNNKFASYNTSTSLYTYTSDTNWSVGRNYLVLASGSKIITNGYIIHNKFLVNNVLPNFVADSVDLNWSRMFKVDGTTIGDNVATLNHRKMKVELLGNLVISGKVWLGPNMTILPQVICTKLNSGVFVSSTTVDTGGNFTLINVDKNTRYKLTLRFPTDSLNSIRDHAVTISDALKSYNEFTSQDLNQTYSHTYLKNGLSYLIADINKNGQFDGGDPYRIYASVSGLNKIDTGTLINALHKSDYDSITLSTNQWTAWPSYVSGHNYVTDTVLTSNIYVDIKYYILGDVDRSHSSKVYDNLGTLITAMNYRGNMDITIPDIQSPVGQPVYVPFNLNTNSDKSYGLQFEMKYDVSKVKFEEIVSDFGSNNWLAYVTLDSVNGILRFGGMDNQKDSGILGELTPFKIKFSPIGNEEVITNIFIRSLMDASDSSGDHYNINFTSSLATMFFKMGAKSIDYTEITAVLTPNPSTGKFQIQFKFPNADMSVVANIYDMRGQLIKSLGTVKPDNLSTIASVSVDLTNDYVGNYFLIIDDKNKRITKQFVKV